MLGARLLVALLSGATLVAVMVSAGNSAAYDDFTDWNTDIKRQKRGGYDYVDYVPSSSYEPKSSHYSHGGGDSHYSHYEHGGGKHYHHHHHSHKYHCKHCYKKHHDKKHVSLTGLLALLAPLAILPLLTGAIAPVSMAPLVVPAMTQVIAGTAAATAGRRRRRRSIQGAQSIHEYLQKVSPNGEYNDEVMAQYLRCSGMLDSKNHCLERLTCQYTAGTLNNLEKEVSSLIIYTIFKNKHIPDEHKNAMRKAASSGKVNPLRCYVFSCENKRDAFSGFRSFKK